MFEGTLPYIGELPIQDIPSALDLLAGVYGIKGGDIYAQEYPNVFSPEGHGIRWGASEGGALLSTAAALPGALKFQGQELPFARVGSVATSESARGRGLAGEILKGLHGALIEKGQAVAGLWAARGGIYARLGYVPMGASYIARGGLRARAPFRGGLKITVGSAPLEPWSRDLDHGFGPELLRAPEELQALLSISPMEVALGSRGGRVVAWACLGRGLDMGGIIHDFGGDVEDVLPLVQRLLGDGGGGVLCPAHHPLRLYLAPGGELGPVMWMKLLDRLRLLDWADSLGLGQGLKALDDAALLQALFGPPGRPKRPLPPPGRLPFFIWGLDSI